MAAPDKILELVERFSQHIDTYKRGIYNETQLRREFIDPFFKVLGWDMENEKDYAEAYKEVVHEDAIKVGAPDYCFRIGGIRKFFLETKKPAINIKEDIHPAFQLRRYAWSAKLPLSILTDFEEFAVYDCRIKPVKTDKPSSSRILLLHYRDYPSRWQEIQDIFSQEAILKGSFDKYVESKKIKKGTAEVDSVFLQEIERWRELLARNLALRNPSLTQRELNFATQLTIDRIIFLRICEDRGIESYGRLMALRNGEHVYQRLFELFRQADDRYNSGLFHFQSEKDCNDAPDQLTPHLMLDDAVLKDIFKNLYYPESPYEFSVLPADILGQVYERFLGKVIRLTDGHQAKIEEKPEVRKAGGVYYTPTYIVDYIVKQTVGKLLEDKTPGPRGTAAKLKILDPACGSGSFLLGAYQYLLNWHLKEYLKDDPEKWAKGRTPCLYKADKAEWKLTTNERKRILLSNIYGVDIDSQAVEVTKLSLLLKVLEGGRQMALFYEKRALPNLSNNIKCGNSLIGSDFYKGQQTNLFDQDEMFRINAFDWDKEFSEIMKDGGFDSVIGNPPYIFTREHLTDAERIYFAKQYKASWEKRNTYMLFMEKMLSLLKIDGFASYIVPNSWLTIESAKHLRPLVISSLTTILDLNYLVFDRVSMEPSIFVLGQRNAKTLVKTCRIQTVSEFLDHKYLPVDRYKWTSPDYRIVFSSSHGVSSVIDQIVSNTKVLGDVFDVRTGLQAYEKGKGSPPQTATDVKNHVFDFDKKVDSNTHRYLQGRDIGRYKLNWSRMWMRYGPWLAQPRDLEIFNRPRVLVREITGEPPYCLHATYVEDDYLNNKSILNILHEKNDQINLKCLCAVLNSRLISLYYKDRAVKGARKIFPKVVIKNIQEFPYPSHITARDQDRLASLVDEKLTKQLELTKISIPADKTAMERKTTTIDHQIDRLVYDLYGLTEEEIKIVEEETRKGW